MSRETDPTKAPVPFIIKKHPSIAVYNDCSDGSNQIRISEITVGSGRIAVNLSASPMKDYLTETAIFASLGLKNAQIGVEATIKEQITAINGYLGSRRRSHFARRFFDLGVYVVKESCNSLQLTPTEMHTVDALSRCATFGEVAKQRSLSTPTVKGHLQGITRRTGWCGQAEIILAALTAGDIGNFALEAAEVQPPVDLFDDYVLTTKTT